MSEQLSALAYRNFVETCRTLATRRVYVKALRYFMEYLHLSPEAYDRLLDQDPKITQMNICDYISFLRKQKSPATVSAYVAAVRKFYSMNESKKSRYFTFCSTECRKEIDSYLEWRKRWGERVQDDSPVFRKEYNTEGKIQVRPITDKAIQNFMNVLLKDTGLRKVPLENQPYQRSHVMMNHGFRKFFETNAFKAGMDHMYLRRLMGQKSGLEDAYLKLSEQDLLEGDSRHIGYIGVIDQLTINEEHKLRREVETLRVEKNSWQALRDELDKVKDYLKEHP